MENDRSETKILIVQIFLSHWLEQTFQRNYAYIGT